ncbi:hypothetical protein BDP81DRAFT_379221 [Colletotrichum phormii]|uniref:CFEM domain-containing protein n=1 Tax=Colletotrichum phormii TaxID=359342 RepID=A0AAI9ZL51_9PEZI|nr:uncharacterized protein BDP81DRAFT_379221 [Colletotrichum phormii]KAK1633934.1 hypothetical protein BDP81DRAFT_379221 [Colletotrichum phormii]
MKQSMRVAIVLLFAVAAQATVSSLNSTEITKLLATTPKCAMPCFVDAFHSGNCTLDGLTDCVCTNIPLQAHTSACIQQACEFDDQVATARISQRLCEDYPFPKRTKSSKVFSIGLPVITILIVALRCLARLQFTNQLWWDDWTALIALAFLIVVSGLGYANAAMGFGLHYWDIDPENGKTILQIFYVLQMLYVFIQVFAKASIACFYSRVFTNRKFRLAVKFYMVFLFSHGFMFLLLTVFQCLPIQSIWNRSIQGHCLNMSAISYAGAACSIIEDIILIVIPIPELMKLQLGKKKRLALVCMFAIGSFACVASMIRVKYLISLANSFDSTWDYFDVVIWSSVELNLAIICGSLPALRPLFKKLLIFFTTIRSTVQSGTHRRKLQAQSTTAVRKYHHSHASYESSTQSSPDNSPQKPHAVKLRDFGGSSTTCDKDAHYTFEMTTDEESKDDLESQDWARAYGK